MCRSFGRPIACNYGRRTTRTTTTDSGRLLNLPERQLKVVDAAQRHCKDSDFTTKTKTKTTTTRHAYLPTIGEHRECLVSSKQQTTGTHRSTIGCNSGRLGKRRLCKRKSLSTTTTTMLNSPSTNVVTDPVRSLSSLSIEDIDKMIEDQLRNVEVSLLEHQVNILQLRMSIVNAKMRLDEAAAAAAGAAKPVIISSPTPHLGSNKEAATTITTKTTASIATKIDVGRAPHLMPFSSLPITTSSAKSSTTTTNNNQAKTCCFHSSSVKLHQQQQQQVFKCPSCLAARKESRWNP